MTWCWCPSSGGSGASWARRIARGVIAGSALTRCRVGGLWPDTADSPDFPLDVPAAFVAGALLGVAADWLQRGCPRTPLEMTILTKPLLIALRPGTGTPPTSQGSR